MEALLTFTFKDFIAFMIPLFIGGLIFNRRRKRKEVRVKFSFLWLVLIIGGILEICDDIYTTYSYRHNHYIIMIRLQPCLTMILQKLFFVGF
jgi:hypothetical protein